MTFQELNYPRRKNFIKSLNILLDTSPVITPEKSLATKLLNYDQRNKNYGNSTQKNFPLNLLKLIQNKNLQSLRKIESKQKPINQHNKIPQQNTLINRMIKSAHQLRHSNSLKIYNNFGLVNENRQELMSARKSQITQRKSISNRQKQINNINHNFQNNASGLSLQLRMVKSTQLPHQANQTARFNIQKTDLSNYNHQSLQIKKSSEGILYDYSPRKSQKKQYLRKGAHIKTKIVNDIIKMKLVKQHKNKYSSSDNKKSTKYGSKNMSIKKLSEDHRNDQSDKSRVQNIQNQNLYIDQDQYLTKMEDSAYNASTIKKQLDNFVDSKQIMNLIKLYKGVQPSKITNNYGNPNRNEQNSKNRSAYAVVPKQVIKQRQKSPNFIQGWFNQSGQFEQNDIHDNHHQTKSLLTKIQ